MRRWLVIVHRYAGLALAGFLFLAGVTGSLLAWNHELEAALSPRLFHATAPAGAEPLDPLVLRERVQAAYPHAVVVHVPLAVVPGHSLVFRLQAQPGAPELGDDQVFVHPYTGALLGARKWGDLTQGARNLMPFIYRLHYTLALDSVGRYLMGVVALLWTLDCFAGAWLTLPARARTPATQGWWSRWRPSWTVRWQGGGYKVNYDLHRAGGLWPWAMLLVLAWSGVAFNLREVYDPAMRALLPHQPRHDAAVLPQPLPAPPLDWIEARAIGREHMAGAARAQGFVVIREHLLRYDPRTGSYDYRVHSDRDVSDHGGITRLRIDARSGAVTGPWLPTGAAAGDSFRTWITTLHMAALWGVPFKLFMGVLGLAVAMLSATGVLIWAKKRAARRRSLALRATPQRGASNLARPGV